MSTRILEARRGSRRVSIFHGACPDTKPAPALKRCKLTGSVTGALRTLALAVIREALPARPFHDGKRRRLVWNLEADRFEVGY